MQKAWKLTWTAARIILGSAMFGLGFNLFLKPNGLNAGGLSGLAMIFTRITGVGSVGLLTMLMNLPLFAISGFKIGKKFVLGSLLGMISAAISIDAMAMFPAPSTEPLIGALYGGLLCGLGLGIVFAAGASTGGSDIIVRLLKRKWQYLPIGVIALSFDLAVVLLTGIVFLDITGALYCGIAIFVTSQVIDAVVYRFDYSRVVLVISSHSYEIASAITKRLNRGVTFLNGQGFFSGRDTRVILTAVRKQQLAELKRLIVGIDPVAFVIVQEAHQVLGDGFSKYSKDSL